MKRLLILLIAIAAGNAITVPPVAFSAASGGSRYISSERARRVAERAVGQDIRATDAEFFERWPDGSFKQQPVWQVSFEDGYCELVMGPPGRPVVEPFGGCPADTVPAHAVVLVHGETAEVLWVASKGVAAD